MSWEQKTVIEQREGFVLLALQGGNFSALCDEWKISRKTGYKWVDCFLRGEGLADRSRHPKQVPNRTPEDVERSYPLGIIDDHCSLALRIEAADSTAR